MSSVLFHLRGPALTLGDFGGKFYACRYDAIIHYMSGVFTIMWAYAYAQTLWYHRLVKNLPDTSFAFGWLFALVTGLLGDAIIFANVGSR